MRPEDQIPFGPPPEEPQPAPEESPQIKREQRLGRYRDLITNFTYDLGRGLQAANQNPRGRAQRTQAGIGAILTAPLALQQAQQQMRASQQGVMQSQEQVLASQQQRESQAQTERRKQMAGEILSHGGTFEEAYGKLIRAGLMTEALQFKKEWQQQQNDESVNASRTSEAENRAFQAAEGSVAPSLQGEIYPPQAPGAQMYQAPAQAARLAPVSVAGQMLQPQSAQDLALAAAQAKEAELKLEAQYRVAPKKTIEERTAEEWLANNPGKNLNDYQTMDVNRRAQATGSRVAPKLTLEERTADEWLQNNPGKSLNDYQTMDVNRRAQSTGSGGLSANQEALEIERLSRRWTSAAATTREIGRQVAIMDAGLSAARKGDMAAGSQAVLVTFQKILDPSSVVRESEYARSAAGQALLARIEGAYERLAKGGAGVPLAELERFASLAKDMAKGSSGNLPVIRRQIGATADRYKIPRDLVLGDEEPDPSLPPTMILNGKTLTLGSDGKYH